MKGGSFVISATPSPPAAGKTDAPPFPDSRERVLRCINTALGRKAQRLVVMNVREMSSFADYFLICSGTSDRQVKAICSHLRENLKKLGMQPLGVEGEKHGRWILMDYDDVVIHIFLAPLRDFYDLERLWADAPRMAIPEEAELIAALAEDL
ncbi:MAG TPA: ribosome silencing factor [Syntrophales bacterium]|jgi:ribosome-associated protein|nr:ribosome silencing factor [Syntrophales bacterium]HON22844.1 ribosome silencing factor [Syntrophales bacterium]HOU76881.1 ribosome silencing factor [Syntrophales bacterium]HPC31650.1 ribosome silencing factor [Syntrophales bacterium]HQG34295.1 ribosome silencing factor [Syntrophales bacterium]